MSMLEVALARLPQLVGTFRVVGVYLRVDGGVFAAGAQRTPSGHRSALGEGDPRHCQVGERRGRSG